MADFMRPPNLEEGDLGGPGYHEAKGSFLVNL
jgi:hypothetical protein